MRYEESGDLFGINHSTGDITWKHISLKTSSYFSVDKERIKYKVGERDILAA